MRNARVKNLLGGAVIALVAGPASAALFTLEDGDTVMNIDTTGGGVIDWYLGGVDIMFQEGFWFRTGTDTREHALTGETITFEQASNTDAHPGDDVLSVIYERAGVFAAEVRYSLQAGSGRDSDLAEQVTIHNLTNDHLRFSLFEYTDFDIAGSIDTVAYKSGQDVFIQTDKSFAITRTAVVPRPDRWEIGFYPSTLSKLEDDDIDNLSNAISPLFNGDLTWAAQWNFNIGVGKSVTISKDKLVSPVPVPATALLMLGALSGLGAVRRLRAG